MIDARAACDKTPAASRSAFNDRRYFIDDVKLAKLGWKEEVEWDQGLEATIKWFLDKDVGTYWAAHFVEAALQPHPKVTWHDVSAPSPACLHPLTPVVSLPGRLAPSSFLIAAAGEHGWICRACIRQPRGRPRVRRRALRASCSCPRVGPPCCVWASSVSASHFSPRLAFFFNESNYPNN